MARAIVWFRRDLRLRDNEALLAATDHDGIVVPVYLLDWEEDYEWRPGEAARWWLQRSLVALGAALAERGAPLLLVSGDPVVVLPTVARALDVERVVWNTVYEPGIAALDERVAAALRAVGVESQAFPGALLAEPEQLVSTAGRPYLQFTAFWRRFLAEWRPPAPAPTPPRLVGLPPALTDGRLGAQVSPAPSRVEEGGEWGWAPRVLSPAEPWDPGEAGAHRRLERLVVDALADYESSRDIPGREGVSRLSPHLHFGEIVPRTVWHEVEQGVGAGAASMAAPAPGLPHAGTGEASFLRQLVWREFAHHLLWHFPHTAFEPFRKEFGHFQWADDPEEFGLWQRGTTGFPLVDAGMRQLLSEGWMHNRVRMVVASFLTKDLLISWQQGAAWFWDRLVDADLANNTLGWQWTAGSGVDAAPYFRIYNPTLQARRFDAQSLYVGRWVPEAVGDKHMSSYPLPMVDHAVARERALAYFRAARKAHASA